MILEGLIFITALIFVMKGATLSTRYATALADSYRLSRYTVGFIIVAFISILPETFVAINAALEGVPSFGLGMLFGSNIADLTLLFALIVFITGRGLKVEGKILKNHVVYPFILLLPIILGSDGNLTRLEGIVLIITGLVFYVLAFRRNGVEIPQVDRPTTPRWYSSLVLLIASMALLLVGAHFTVTSATALAEMIGISPVVIGMLVVSLGTTMPEFFFALRSAQQKDDSLAVGDILGTVLADATVVVGILALIRPFAFPLSIVYGTGVFMVLASVILFYFMQTGRMISRKEGVLLLLFWVVFMFFELVVL